MPGLISYTESVVALGAGVLGLVAGVVGVLAVLRRRALMADALAHATLPGVAAGFLVAGAKDASTLLVGAAVAALLGALAMLAIERVGRIRADAAIGVVLSGGFALGIVLISYLGGTGAADQAGLDDYLFGQAAGLLVRDVVVFGLLGAAAIGLVAVAYRPFKLALFDPEFAAAAGVRVRALEALATVLLVVAVIVGVRTVGAVLMVAMIAVPVSAARQFAGRLTTVLVLSGLVGAGVGITGALLSSRAGVPTGPVVVLVGVSAVFAALLLAPGRGVLWRLRRLRADRARRLRDALLRDLRTAGPVTATALAAATGRPRTALRRGLDALVREGALRVEDGRLVLTPAGAAAALDARERRDLWSAWLEHGWRLGLPGTVEPDPADPRAALGDDAAARLRALTAKAPV